LGSIPRLLAQDGEDVVFLQDEVLRAVSLGPGVLAVKMDRSPFFTSERPGFHLTLAVSDGAPSRAGFFLRGIGMMIPPVFSSDSSTLYQEPMCSGRISMTQSPFDLVKTGVESSLV
jgi:hypothetical protein